jgi:hypothetical protein
MSVISYQLSVTRNREISDYRLLITDDWFHHAANATSTANGVRKMPR